MANFFSIYENPDFSEEDVQVGFVTSTARTEKCSSGIHLLKEKLRTPQAENQILRPRLTDLLKNSLNKFGATLISGRSGTGKTALAADFARRYKNVSWYSVDSSEADWEIFFKYFEASLTQANGEPVDESGECDPEQKLEKIAFNTERLITKVSAKDKSKNRLIVLDDSHHLFDSDWFTAFFNSLVGSLGPKMHLLMLCRGTPSLPLWRLRSKQVLGVIDENALNFSIEEARELVSSLGLPIESAAKLQRKSFGRVLKLKQLADSLK